jgi:hypothetical protein
MILFFKKRQMVKCNSKVNDNNNLNIVRVIAIKRHQFSSLHSLRVIAIIAAGNCSTWLFGTQDRNTSNRLKLLCNGFLSKSFGGK